MIKAVVFDLDNTLIPWTDDFDEITRKCLTECNLVVDEKMFENFQSALKAYEDTHVRFDKWEMSKYLAEYIEEDIPDDFAEKWTLSLYEAVPREIDKQLIEVLEYLKNKYDLYVITNWFTKQQMVRLENYGILKYFTAVYGCDDYDRKPYPEMMNLVLKTYAKDEVVYVGDNYDVDIQFAMNLGVYSYYITKNNKEKTDKYRVIASVYELEKYL